MVDQFEDQTRLVFHGDGYDAEHTVGDETFMIRGATVERDHPSIDRRIEVNPGADMRHVALYAVFLSTTSGKYVYLHRHNIGGLGLDVRSIAETTETTPEEESQILSRFQTIEGADDISQLQKVRIGQIARDLETTPFFLAE